jgi:parvulin-like peptidyl-prolyl isomerase
MSKGQTAPRITRKHLARAEREARQRRWILIGAVIVAILVVGIVGYGLVDSLIVKPNQTIAQVNDQEINAGTFEKRVRWEQRNLISQLNSNYELLSLFAGDPELAQTIEQQMNGLQAQLANPGLLGSSVINSLIDEALFAQEADRRGIEVAETEVDQAIEELFGFNPDDAPPVEPETVLPTAEPSEEEESSSSATSTPVPTATPYTREAFEDDYREFIRSLRSFRLNEAFFRDLVTQDLLREKVREDFEAGVEQPIQREFVLLRHIQLAEEEQAMSALERLEAGEEWSDLVVELSQDTGTIENEGEIGWLMERDILLQFGTAALAAFGAEVGGDAIGPVQTAAGWHIFQVVGRENREVPADRMPEIIQELYTEWYNQLRTDSEFEIIEGWEEYLPSGIGSAPS